MRINLEATNDNEKTIETECAKGGITKTKFRG